MSGTSLESSIRKPEDEYLQCKNRMFEELIKFVYQPIKYTK